MRALGTLFVATALLAASGGAYAQPKGKPPKGQPAAPAVDVKAIGDKVKSGDPARVAEGIKEAQAGGAAAAAVAPAIEDVLKRGANVAVTKAALEALGAIGAQSSSAVIRPYLKHRTQDVRRAAVRALGSTKGPEAVAGFREGLRAEDGMIRGFSATGLGNLGAGESVPDLFLALDRNVTEAAGAIGQLCTPEDCEKLAGRLGKIALDVMTSGFDPILFRAKPLPDEALLKIVGRLRELGTPESAKYLADVQERWPANGSKKVKQAIDSAVSAIPGGAK